MKNEASQVVQDLFHLASALSIAVQDHFMSVEHGASVWKSFLKKSGIDVAKKTESTKTERG